MKKKKQSQRCFLAVGWLCLIGMLGVLPVNASVFAQQERVVFQTEQLTVREIFDAIATQLQYDVFYNSELLQPGRKVALQEKEMNVEEVLKQVLGDRFSYHVENRTIVIVPAVAGQPQAEAVKLKGQVKDNAGNVLPGVTVVLKGTSVGTSTDAEGKFELTLRKMDKMALLFSFIGMKTREVNVSNPDKPLNEIGRAHV